MPLARHWGSQAVALLGSSANIVSLSLPQAQADEQHEQTFESVSAGASLTYPMQCSALRKGGHIVIKGKPCKVSSSPSEQFQAAAALREQRFGRRNEQS